MNDRLNFLLKVSRFESTQALADGTFRVRADFEVHSSERVALFSPSGSGKTTLLRWMAGIADGKPAGTLLRGEVDLTRLPPERREIGFVFQDYALFPEWTALENVAFGLEMRGASATERNARAAEWLEKLGLGSRAATPAGLLSGGEKQRVALARALVWNPKTLILDEPFAALDLAHRKNAREVVKSLLEKNAVPTIFVTHDADDVAALATRTLTYSVSDDGMTHTFA
jgi:putative spermidine/putrescine transport system ATP-binding protein